MPVLRASTRWLDLLLVVTVLRASTRCLGLLLVVTVLRASIRCLGLLLVVAARLGSMALHQDRVPKCLHVLVYVLRVSMVLQRDRLQKKLRVGALREHTRLTERVWNAQTV